MKKYFFEINNDGVYVDDYCLDTALLFGKDHEKIERYDLEVQALCRIIIDEQWSSERIITKICDLFDIYYNADNDLMRRKYLYIWWQFCNTIFPPDQVNHFTYQYERSKVYTIDI